MNPSQPVRKRDFDLVDIGVGTLLLLVAIFVNKFGVVGNAAFFALLAVMAVSPVKIAFQGLVLAILGLCANQAIVLKTAIWAYGRFAVLVGLSTRFLFFDQAATRYSLFREGRYIALCLFCLMACITSLAANNRPEIAILKVFLFWISLSGVWSAIGCMRAARADVAPWMVKIVATVCGMNILSLVLGIGSNFRDTARAQGLFNLGFYHSQTVGPACAMMIVYLVSVWLFTAYRNRWICGPLILVLLYSMYLSGSRTGFLTLVSGIAAILMFTLMWRGNRLHVIRLNMSRSKLVFTALGLAVIVFVADIGTGGRVSRSVASFLLKSKKEVDVVTIEGITASRQQLIERAMVNFRQSPLIGNGFQMYADREATRNTTIMTSQVEKGFLPAAILEETGVLGTGFFLIFIWQCFAHYVRDRNIPGIAAFIALLGMNLGECSFFSFAGHGGLIWSYVAAADLLGVGSKVPKRVVWPQPSSLNPRRIFDRAAAL